MPNVVEINAHAIRLKVRNNWNQLFFLKKAPFYFIFKPQKN